MPINVAKLPENTALHFMFILAKVFHDFCQLQDIIKRQSQPTIPTWEVSRQHCPPTSLGRLYPKQLSCSKLNPQISVQPNLTPQPKDVLLFIAEVLSMTRSRLPLKMCNPHKHNSHFTYWVSVSLPRDAFHRQE
jgi:hypothetical protein